MSVKTSPYMRIVEVCRIMGFPPTRAGQMSARELLVAKIRRAKGKLDKYDPRVGRGARARYRVTMVTLKHLCPELVDPDLELAEALRERLDELGARIDALGARLAREERMSKGRAEVLAKAIRKTRAER